MVIPLLQEKLEETLSQDLSLQSQIVSQDDVLAIVCGNKHWSMYMVWALDHPLHMCSEDLSNILMSWHLLLVVLVTHKCTKSVEFGVRIKNWAWKVIVNGRSIDINFSKNTWDSSWWNCCFDGWPSTGKFLFFSLHAHVCLP